RAALARRHELHAGGGRDEGAARAAGADLRSPAAPFPRPGCRNVVHGWPGVAVGGSPLSPRTIPGTVRPLSSLRGVPLATLYAGAGYARGKSRSLGSGNEWGGAAEREWSDAGHPGRCAGGPGDHFLLHDHHAPRGVAADAARRRLHRLARGCHRAGPAAVWLAGGDRGWDRGKLDRLAVVPSPGPGRWRFQSLRRAADPGARRGHYPGVRGGATREAARGLARARPKDLSGGLTAGGLAGRPGWWRAGSRHSAPRRRS